MNRNILLFVLLSLPFIASAQTLTVVEGDDEVKRNKFSEVYGKKTATYGALEWTMSKHINKADTIMTDLADRAAVEGANLVDREVNLAYDTEKENIERAQSIFQMNINKIIPMGGSNDSRKQWQELYNLSTYAVHVINSSYVPNTKRKIEYKKIYDDLINQNDQLTAYLQELNDYRLLQKYREVAEKAIPTADKSKAATDALSRLSSVFNKEKK